MPKNLFQYATVEEAVKELGELQPQFEEEFQRRTAVLLAKGWITRKPSGQFWRIYQWLKLNIHYGDMDCLSITTGSEGTGKTNFDLLAGAYFDENFAPDTLRSRIFYTYLDVDDFFENEPQFSFGFVDEGSLFPARGYMSPESQALVNTLMVARANINSMIMVNIPYFGELDTFLRNQRLKFVVKCNVRMNPRTTIVSKGTFDFFTKKRSYDIHKDTFGKLKFPRPNSSGYCPKVGGDLWRAYKEIEGTRKAELRKANRDKVEKKGRKDNEERTID